MSKLRERLTWKKMLIFMMANTRRRQGTMTMTMIAFTQMILMVMTTMTVATKSSKNYDVVL